MATSDPYEKLSMNQLKKRLKIAEDVCVMFGWGPVGRTVREKAATQLWMRWAQEVGTTFTSPDAHPDLDEDALAAQRDEVRNRTAGIAANLSPSGE